MFPFHQSFGRKNLSIFGRWATLLYVFLGLILTEQKTSHWVDCYGSYQQISPRAVHWERRERLLTRILCHSSAGAAAHSPHPPASPGANSQGARYSRCSFLQTEGAELCCQGRDGRERRAPQMMKSSKQQLQLLPVADSADLIGPPPGAAEIQSGQTLLQTRCC